MNDYTIEGEYIHLKTGNRYDVIDNGRLESTLEPVTIYISHETGETWVRPTKEFNDGRFKIVRDRKN